MWSTFQSGREPDLNNTALIPSEEQETEIPPKCPAPLGYGIFQFYVSLQAHAHTFTHSHAAVRHILMALLWPEHAWSGPGCGRDPGLTATHQSYRDGKNQGDWKKKKTKRETKTTHAHWRNSRSCWVTGVETKKMGIISLSFFVFFLTLFSL